MNYELAKELKDAGFPQDTHFYYSNHTSPPTYWDINVLNDMEIDGEVLIAAPTLSELIEACGREDVFNEKTHYFRLETNSQDWWAGFVDNSESELFAIRQKGSTPEEAVGRLYLALYANDKKTKTN